MIRKHIGERETPDKINGEAVEGPHVDFYRFFHVHLACVAT
jgi:hypothetical protein